MRIRIHQLDAAQNLTEPNRIELSSAEANSEQFGLAIHVLAARALQLVCSTTRRRHERLYRWWNFGLSFI